MYKFILTAMVLVSATLVQAQNNDFVRSESKKELLAASDIRRRFELHGEVYVTDSSGKLLYTGNETRLWKFGSKGDLSGNWTFQSPDIEEVALRQTWTIADDGKITAHIEQFDSIKRTVDRTDLILGKKLREEKFQLKDFTPVIWVARETANERVVVRLIPMLEEKADYIEANALPITLADSVVYDNQGRLWSNTRDLEGRYVAMKTHLGLVAFSYVNFKGAQEIGYVQGSEAIINANPNLKITIRSSAPILATNRRAKIYGLVDMSKKSERYNSVISSASSTEKGFLDTLR